MQVQKIQDNSTAFGHIYREQNVPRALFDSLIQTPAVKKFGEKFDAVLSVDTFYSSREKNRIQYALKMDEITPRGVLGKLKKIISGNKISSIKLKTHALSEEELRESVANMRSNTLLNIYKNS